MACYGGREPDDGDRRKNTGGFGESEDGCTSSSKSDTSSCSTQYSNTFILVKPDAENGIGLFPVGGGLQSLDQGSSGGIKALSDSNVNTALTNRKRCFIRTMQIVPCKWEVKEDSQRFAASNQESSQGHNNQSTAASRKTSSKSKKKWQTVKVLKRGTKPKVSEVKNRTDGQVKSKSVEIENLDLRGLDYPNDDVERKTKYLMDEFLPNIDFEEAIICVSGLTSPHNVHVFITYAIDEVLKRSTQDRYYLGHLLYSLLKREIIAFDQYKKGFRKVLSMIEAYASSNPFIWDYMGEILQPLIKDRHFSLALVKDVLQICIPSEVAVKILYAIVDLVIKDKELESNVRPAKIELDAQMSIEEIIKLIWGLLDKGEENEEPNIDERSLEIQSQPMPLSKPIDSRNLDGMKDKMHAPVDHCSQGEGDEALHKSHNAWKPMHKREIPDDANMEERQKEILRGKVQGVLNKLTPKTFATLLAELKCRTLLNVDTEEQLSLIVDVIFENAMNASKFLVAYANLCKHLALIKVPVAGTNGTEVNFRRLLVAKCQKEFEQDKSDKLKNEERIKVSEEADPEKKKELKLAYNEEEKKNKYRRLKNIRFIGELFKQGMLIEPIMHECIRKLLSQGDEESLECLCRLLKRTGKELDGRIAANNSRNNQMNLYFELMKKIVDIRLTSSRVKFMLQDVIDLRKDDWVPRRKRNNSKTIVRIHKRVQREAREQQQVCQNMENYPKRIPEDRDGKENTGPKGSRDNSAEKADDISVNDDAI